MPREQRVSIRAPDIGVLWRVFQHTLIDAQVLRLLPRHLALRAGWWTDVGVLNDFARAVVWFHRNVLLLLRQDHTLAVGPAAVTLVCRGRVCGCHKGCHRGTKGG